MARSRCRERSIRRRRCTRWSPSATTTRKPSPHFDPATGRIAVSGGALRVRNSWGAQWGDGGYGWLPYDYIRAGLTSDWWCLVRADYLDIGDFTPPAGNS